MKDLFEDYNNMPIELKKVCDNYSKKYEDYIPKKDMDIFLNKVNKLGYTFEYGLDLVPFGLRPIGIDIDDLD